MKRLTTKQVVQMHSFLIKETGGSDGLRDKGLLESALNAPFQTFDGEELYKTVQAKAAKLGYYLISISSSSVTLSISRILCSVSGICSPVVLLICIKIL